MSDDIDNNPIQNPPDNKDIEKLLRMFTPQPTAQFYLKMRTAPWQRLSPPMVPRKSIYLMPDHKVIWGLVALGLVCAILLILLIPSARAAASQIIHLFLPASSNQLDVQVTLTSPGDLLDFSDPTNFPLRVAEAQQLAGFSVRQIASLPGSLTFIGSRYDPSYNSVTLLYIGNKYKLFLTQRPLGNGEDLFNIGASANVNNVKIGNNDGEFVVGGLKAVSTQLAPDTQHPKSAVNIYAILDNNLPQFTLRWQVDDVVYELRSDG